MANRRMFSLDVVNTDNFMEMPLTAQALYFHLGMRADDDGFISSPEQIMKAVECKQDDMKILISKGYVIPFESGIVVIRHWKQHNYIQADRYRKTKFTEERKRLELKENIYVTNNECIQGVYSMEAQYRLSKDIVRDSIELGNIICTEPDKPAPDLSGLLLPLNDNTYYDVPKESISKWRDTYPAVDVEQQLKQMTAWLDANPRRRKTRRGINAFINSWLAREQDRCGVYRNGGSRQQETPANNDLPQEYKEMYAKYLGKNLPDPDAPFQ